MNKRLGYAIFAFILIALITLSYRAFNTPSPTSVTLQPNNQKITQQGGKLYLSHCAICHGKQLEGQKNWQFRKPDGRMLAPPHNAEGHTWHHSDKYLFSVTKWGIEKTAGQQYPNDMPIFQNLLSDQEIIAVLSFIKSQWPAEIKERHDEVNLRANKTK